MNDRIIPTKFVPKKTDMRNSEFLKDMESHTTNNLVDRRVLVAGKSIPGAELGIWLAIKKDLSPLFTIFPSSTYEATPSVWICQSLIIRKHTAISQEKFLFVVSTDNKAGTMDTYMDTSKKGLRH